MQDDGGGRVPGGLGSEGVVTMFRDGDVFENQEKLQVVLLNLCISEGVFSFCWVISGLLILYED